ncbi:MAG: pyridoxamine 5'-phosphate oxidase family protein, partial [Desulfovibrio sp.]|nr:pyridoxamine 5'-phosphate oxidase family protein [Desulfovibrio sp.]
VDGMQPYAVPLSFVLYEQKIFFHSAYEGRKIRVLEHSQEAQFTVIGRTKPVYANSFTTYYESAMAFGVVKSVTDEERKRTILLLFAKKYLPEYFDQAFSAIERSLGRTHILAMEVRDITGKAKLPNTDAKGDEEKKRNPFEKRL